MSLLSKFSACPLRLSTNEPGVARLRICIVQRIRREFGSSVAYNATILASIDGEDGDEVGEVLRNLGSEAPLVRSAEAPAGTELVELEFEEEGEGTTDLSMYARTSLKAFVAMVEEADVVVNHVARVTYTLVDCSEENIASHVVVFGEDGFHLCSCLQLLQHGFPCRHFFAVLRMNGPGKPSACSDFHAQCVHPRWRKTRSLDNESWTASVVVPDEFRWTGAEGPTIDDPGDVSGAIADSAPKISDGARRKVYADIMAKARVMAASLADSVSPAVALDIFDAAAEVANSRLRAEGVGTAPVPGGGLANPKPAVTKGRKKKKRHKDSTSR